MVTIETDRFDTRLPKEQKEYFQYAANLGGFRTLTEFIIFSAQQHAAQIVEKHQAILASKRDREVFFAAMMNPPKPNNKLKKAALRYKKAVAEK
jgi:uncharacterized protein (DUF1778 family)